MLIHFLQNLSNIFQRPLAICVLEFGKLWLMLIRNLFMMNNTREKMMRD